MLTVLKKIIIVLVAVILIDKAFTYAFMQFVFKKTISGESGGTINYVINTKKNLDFLIIGASRAKHSMDPSVLTSLGTYGYNLGINGTTVLNSYLVLDVLLHNNVKPKTLIVQTDVSDYVSDTDAKTIDQIKRVYPYDTPLIQSYVKRMGYVERMKYFFGTYRLNRKVMNIAFNFLKKNTISDTNGYVGLPSIPEAPSATSIADDYVYNRTTTAREAIKGIKKLCDENNINLIVVFAPSYENVFRNNEAQKNLVEDLKKEGITHIIDFSDVKKNPELEGSENWRDAIHFDALGAEKFSKLLNKEISNEITVK